MAAAMRFIVAGLCMLGSGPLVHAGIVAQVISDSDTISMYNKATIITKSSRGCGDCECTYLGGMCRTNSEMACCEDVCCGHDAEFPMAAIAPSRAMLNGPGLEPAKAATVASEESQISDYKQVKSLFKSARGCGDCECAYLGGMCRTNSEMACCEDVCCGHDAEFPMAAIAPSRAMLNGPGLEPAEAATIASEESQISDYKKVKSLFKSARGCGDCECAYLGGMCRTNSEMACCEDVCCGHDAEFPMAAIAPSRAMLNGPGLKPSEQVDEPPASSSSTAQHSTAHVTTIATSTTLAPTTAVESSTSLAPTTTVESSTTLAPSAMTTEAVSSTTAPYCFDHGSSWSPDMVGESISQEKDALACQQRCADTAGCVHFSFFEPSRNCQIQDSFAMRHSGLPGYISGPMRCWGNVNHTAFAKADQDVIVPKEFKCLEPGVAFSPSMASPINIDGDREEVVRACRQRCADTEGCEHFTVLMPSTCHLVGADATRVAGVELAISGFPRGACATSHLFGDVLEVIMRKSSVSKGDLAGSAASPPSHPAPAPRSQSTTLVLVTYGALGAVVTLAVAVVLGRRRRDGVRGARTALATADLDEDPELAIE